MKMKQRVFNLIILDESGSMTTIEKQAVDGVNETVQTIRAAQKKHLKGESPCCGGGDTIIIEDKKLDGPVIGKKTVKISGMHCDHCVRAVTEAINKIDGASAKINLKKNEAVVSCEKVVEDAAIREAVEKAGYTVQSIQG